MLSFHSNAEAGKDLERERVLSNLSEDPKDRRVSFASVPETKERHRTGDSIGQSASARDPAAGNAAFTLSPTENSPISPQDTLSGHSSKPDPLSERESPQNTLRTQLNEAFIRSAYDDTESISFLPRSVIHDLLKPQSIREHLLKLTRSGLYEECSTVLDYFCGQQEDNTGRKTRYIFAILVLMDEPRLLPGIVRDNVCDDDLPLERIQISGTDFQLAKKSDPVRPIECFKEWTVAQRRFFDDLQWQIKVPVLNNWPFRLPVTEFPSRAVFPFTDYDQKNKYKGNSEVVRVKIHPAHHILSNGAELPRASEDFALKILQADDNVAFRLEIKALTKIKTKPNLVTAVAAFKYRDKYHILSKWADGGNLTDFWKTQTPSLTRPTICWLSQQCYGLADGLNGIHNAQVSVTELENLRDPSAPAFSNSPFLSQGSPPNPIVEDDKKVHGRHGDMKPHNILWFSQEENEYGLGVLKITDFGVTAFHSAQTTQVTARGLLVTKTYAAPEFDIPGAHVSRPFDIWSLGCLYLEFITWVLLGAKSVETFAEERQNERGSRKKFQEDNFYSIHGRSYIFWPVEYATIKQSVTRWINKLKQDRKCSLFLHDFLSYIEDRMLVVDKRERDKSSMVCVKLHAMFDKCKKDLDYALGPMRRDGRLEISDEAQGSFSNQGQRRLFYFC